jgi:hypothetical protein
METRGFWTLGGISNAQLERDLQQLLIKGAATEARVIAHLAEVETRRLHAIRGQSLWSYCQQCLGFSDFEAYLRINAARIARRFPIVFDMLERRQLHLTALCEARPYLTTENHHDLLLALCHKPKPKFASSSQLNSQNPMSRPASANSRVRVATKRRSWS